MQLAEQMVLTSWGFQRAFIDRYALQRRVLMREGIVDYIKAHFQDFISQLSSFAAGRLTM
jgi:hypothetical protein